MRKLMAKQVPVWVLVVVAGSVLVGGMGTMLALGSGATWSSGSVNTQVVRSVTLEEQVVLMGLSIEGISRKQDKGDFWGFEIPGSERATFISYSFTAKVGLEGKDVKIAPIGDKRYRVSIPQFIFIGIDDPKIELLVENNGVLSGVTPAIDQLEVINEALATDHRAAQVAKHQDALQYQAKTFYDRIVHAIDPSIFLEFEFANP